MAKASLFFALPEVGGLKVLNSLYSQCLQQQKNVETRYLVPFDASVGLQQNFSENLWQMTGADLGGVQGVRTPALLLGVPFFKNNKFSKCCLFPLRIASEVIDFD